MFLRDLSWISIINIHWPGGSALPLESGTRQNPSSTFDVTWYTGECCLHLVIYLFMPFRPLIHQFLLFAELFLVIHLPERNALLIFELEALVFLVFRAFGSSITLPIILYGFQSHHPAGSEVSRREKHAR